MIGHLLDQIAKYEQQQSELEAQMTALRALIAEAKQDGQSETGEDGLLSRLEFLYRALSELFYDLGRVDALLEDARMRAGSFAPARRRRASCDVDDPGSPGRARSSAAAADAQRALPLAPRANNG